MSDKTDGILKEYDSLRQEIRTTESSILQLLTIMFSATGVIMTAGFSKGNPTIFVIPIVLMQITGHYVADKRWVIWLIAGYLRIWVEDEALGLMWETRLAQYREICEREQKKKHNIFKPAQNIMTVEWGMFTMIGLINWFLVCYYCAASNINLTINQALTTGQGNPLSDFLIHAQRYSYLLTVILASLFLLLLIINSTRNFLKLSKVGGEHSEVIEQWRRTHEEALSKLTKKA